MSVGLAWALVGAAVLAEVGGTSLLRATEGFSRLVPSVAVLGLYAVSFALMARAVTALQVSIVYAVWSAAGTAAIAVVGVLFLGEPLGTVKVLGLALIIAGVVVLNLAGATH